MTTDSDDVTADSPGVAADTPGVAADSAEAAARPGVPANVRSALGRFRVAAWVVGVGLLLLVVAMVLRYGFDQRWAVTVWGPIHGVLYMAYVLLAFDLAYKARWSIPGTLGVLLSGAVPVLSFYVEHVVTRRVRAGRRV